MRIGPRLSPRAAALLQGFAVAVLSASGQARGPDEFRPAPRFEGATIPDPPRQKEPWTPPESPLPKFLPAATSALFGQGLADPRGCDYRSVEVAVGNVWSGDGGVVKERGWVLPAPGDGGTPRFAVCWNGLVYPTVSVGGPADLKADVRALAEAHTAAEKANASRPRGAGGFYAFGTNNEGSAVSHLTLHPIKVCLLLRLGETDLAQAVWDAGTGRARADAGGKARAAPKIDLSGYGVSYLSLATDLAWYHFDRAVCAHMRGDDALALADARALSALRKAAEAKAEAMGFPHPQGMNRGDPPRPYIEFLHQLPEFLADHERRAAEPKRAPVPPPGGDRSARINALIRDLDQVAARQWGQPGGVSLGEDPIVQALIAEGDDAVEPLIDALEHDVRLTRSVHFHRDFFRSRTVMGAHEAAYTALSGLLKTPFFGAASTGDNLSARGKTGRKEVADRVRAYWQKNRNVPLVERWYRTLADDRAGPGQWLQAAGNIAQRENVSVVPGSTVFVETVTTEPAPGARPGFRGESLRAKKDPSVSELMARRVDEIDPGGGVKDGLGDQFKVGSANQMAALLAAWDVKASLPVLKARVKRCARFVQEGQAARSRYYGMEVGIANLTRLRAKAGDPGAIDDYADWVRTVTPDQFSFSPVELFEPLWRNPDHPAAAAAAVALFEDPKSPWNPLIRPGETNPNDGGFRVDAIASPLLGLKPFRALVLKGLADRSQVGTVEVDGAKVTVIRGNNKTVYDGQATSVGTSSEAPRPGPSAMPLRVADLTCEKLQELEGTPRFETRWPLSKRDEVIASCAAFLRQYGERFRDSEAARPIHESAPFYPQHAKAVLAFDPLDHPATAEDVREGRAIFALEGKEVRRRPLPAFPISARWKALKIDDDDPGLRGFDRSQGKPTAQIQMLQTGRVWQAEEVREGDHWRRYYGFVGRDALSRVPAEELEFRPDWQTGWRPLSAALDGRIVPPGSRAAGARVFGGPVAVGGPLPVEVWFRNRQGVETTVPADWVRAAEGGATLREGVSVRLSRAADAPEPETLPTPRRQPPITWEGVPARPNRSHPAGDATQTFAPAEAAQALKFDLRDLFTVDRPGRYRVEVDFHGFKTAEGTAGTLAEEFPVTGPAKGSAP